MMHQPAMLDVGTSALLQIIHSATAIILVVSPQEFQNEMRDARRTGHDR